MSSKIAELLETKVLQAALAESFREMQRIALDVSNMQGENQRLQSEIEVLRRDIRSVDTLLNTQTTSMAKLESAQREMVSNVNALDELVRQNESEIETLTEEAAQLFRDNSDDAHWMFSILDNRLEMQEWLYLTKTNIPGLFNWVESLGEDRRLRFDAGEITVDSFTMYALVGSDEFYQVEMLSFFGASEVSEGAFFSMMHNLKKESALQKLILSESSVTTSVLLRLIEIDPFPHLTSLYISDCDGVDIIPVLDALVGSALGQRIENLRVKGYGLKRRQRDDYMSRLPNVHDEDSFRI